MRNNRIWCETFSHKLKISRSRNSSVNVPRPTKVNALKSPVSMDLSKQYTCTKKRRANSEILAKMRPPCMFDGKMNESTQCDGRLAIQVWCAPWKCHATYNSTMDAFNVRRNTLFSFQIGKVAMRFSTSIMHSYSIRWSKVNGNFSAN